MSDEVRRKPLMTMQDTPQSSPVRPPAAIDLAEINLGLLLALEALLSERNVTRAATKLGIGQPALSTRLQRLRQIFADPLFVAASNGRGVVPTARALDLQADIADVLTRMRRLVEGPADFVPAASRRTFVIAVQENPAMILAPGLVAQVIAAAPGARLAFIHPPPDVVDRLERGEIDVFVSGSDSAAPDLIRRPLVEDDMLTAQRKGHPRGTGPLDIDAFCALDHVLVSAHGGSFSGVIDEVLASIGRARRVAVSVQNYTLVPAILGHSDCISTLPRRFLSRFAAELDLFQPPLALSRVQLVALWHPRNRDDGGHRWLRGRLFEAATGASAPV